MVSDKSRFLLVVVCAVLMGSFLLLAGISPADAEPVTTTPTLDAVAWSFLPVVRSMVQGPPAPTSTERPPPERPNVSLNPPPAPTGAPANGATATATPSPMATAAATN